MRNESLPRPQRAQLLSSATVSPLSVPVDPALASCWTLHDGAAGNRRQAQALATALGLAARDWNLHASLPARWLAPHRYPGADAAFGHAFVEALRADPPALAIGCGRLAALATRQARRAGARAVQVLDPRIATRHWDLVVAPEHDALVGDNVITLLGSLNPVDDAWLDAARARFAALGELPGPRTTVLLGGPTRATRFDRSALDTLLATLDLWLARDGGSLLLLGSGRTPRAWAPVLRARYRDGPHRVWMDAGDGENFYPGALAWADRIVASPDSVNMISEACATDRPVFVAEPERATGRVRRFLRSLQERDRIRAQDRDGASFEATPLRETQRVAAQLRARLIPG